MKQRPLFNVSLCLSRACLGKMIAFHSYRYEKTVQNKGVVSHPSRLSQRAEHCRCDRADVFIVRDELTQPVQMTK